MSGMRILIVSDTHRRDGNFRRVLEKTGPIDMLIHLGDTEGSGPGKQRFLFLL